MAFFPPPLMGADQFPMAALIVWHVLLAGAAAAAKLTAGSG